MAKVTRVGGRGTTRRKTDTKKKSTFAGDSYKEYRAESEVQKCLEVNGYVIIEIESDKQ